jgi:hypothetical protein
MTTGVTASEDDAGCATSGGWTNTGCPAATSAWGLRSQQVGPGGRAGSRTGAAGAQCEHFAAGAGVTRQARPSDSIPHVIPVRPVSTPTVQRSALATSGVTAKNTVRT